MKNEARNNRSGGYEGYPLYPASEDIYNKAERVPGVDTAEVKNKIKTKSNRKSLRWDETDFEDELSGSDLDMPHSETDKNWNEKSFFDDVSGDDLDVPGSELDDDREETGNEDEENNYYSLGSDNHVDLDEREDI